MSNVFRPSRRYRRQFSGQPCPACGNRVDPNDLVAFAPGGGQTFYLHESCVEVALEAAAARPHLEEETGTGATAAGSIVASETEEA